MPRTSDRGSQVPLSPFRKLIGYADAAKAKGKHVYHLNIGQPDIPTPPHAVVALQQTPIKTLAYSPAIGILSYRQKLVEYYRSFDVEVTVDNIMVMTGASEAIQMLMYACFDAGDELIIPEPFYANYNGFAKIANVKIKSITCHIADGFALPDVAAFEALITEKTKAIFITNPNNPTGCFYSKEVLLALGELAIKYDLYLFVDEVYRDFCFDGNEFFSVLNIPGAENNVVVVDSVSKRYSACGARVGSIVTRNMEVVKTISKYAKLRLSPPGLGQILSEAMIDGSDEYMAAVKEEYDRRRLVVYYRLQQMPDVISYKPGGAFYCFAKFPIEDADHFCQWLLEDFEYKGATVMLSPGAGFYSTLGLGLDEVRMAFVLNTDDLEAAMDCLEKALEVYPQRTNRVLELSNSIAR